MKCYLLVIPTVMLFVNLMCNFFCIVNLLKNSLAVKKGAALFKMASVKKVVKSKGRPRNGCDGIG